MVNDLITRILRSYEDYRNRAPKADADWESEEIGYEGLQTLIDQEPMKAWEVIQGLVAGAPDYALAYVGAGPLEDLVDLHGAEFIDQIEQYSRENLRMKRALESDGHSSLGF